jgi:hypothetical protein
MLVPLCLFALQLGAGSSPPFDEGGLHTLATVEAAPWLQALQLTADFEAVDLGDLDQDGHVDAVVRTSTDAVFFPWLEVATAALPVSSAGKTGTVLGSTLLGPLGSLPPALACVGPKGLVVMKWSAASADFIVTDLIKGSWVGATAVIGIDVDGDGVEDLAGLSAAGTEVLIQKRSSNGGFSWKQPIQLVTPAHALIGLQWTPDAELEIAVETAAGLEVRDGDGTLLLSRPAVGAGASMARISSDAGLEGIAWFTGADAAGFSTLETFDATGPLATKTFANHVASEVVSGDIDADGDLDLALTWLDRSDVRLLECSAKGTFTGWSEGLVGAVKPALYRHEGHTARGVLGDLDSDGGLDFVLPSTLERALLIYKELAHTPTSLDQGQLANADPAFCFHEGTIVGELGLPFEFQGPAAVTSFEITVWEQVGARSLLTPLAASNTVIPRPSDGQGGYMPSFTIDVQLPAPTTYWHFDTRLFTITIEALNAAGEPVGPTRVGIFASRSGDLDLTLMHAAWQKPWEVDLMSVCEPVVPPGGTATGAWIRAKRMPPLPPRKVPLKKDD